MKLAYYSESDVLYIELLPKEAETSTEVAPGLTLHSAGNGQVTGISIAGANAGRVDFSNLNSYDLPIRHVNVSGKGVNISSSCG